MCKQDHELHEFSSNVQAINEYGDKTTFRTIDSSPLVLPFLSQNSGMLVHVTHFFSWKLAYMLDWIIFVDKSHNSLFVESFTAGRRWWSRSFCLGNSQCNFHPASCDSLLNPVTWKHNRLYREKVSFCILLDLAEIVVNLKMNGICIEVYVFKALTVIFFPKAFIILIIFRGMDCYLSIYYLHSPYCLGWILFELEVFKRVPLTYVYNGEYLLLDPRYISNTSWPH